VLKPENVFIEKHASIEKRVLNPENIDTSLPLSEATAALFLHCIDGKGMENAC